MEKTTDSYFEQLKHARLFKNRGLLGLIDDEGNVHLPAEYDQIEICEDFIYCHTFGYNVFIRKDGSVLKERDITGDLLDFYEPDMRFYANGHVGLKDKSGDVLLPPQYDEIIDWDDIDGRFDVIYVRKGNEFHYYNHKLEEILTEIKPISDDRYPLCPFSFSEDEDRNVLLCVEPSNTKKGSSDCFAYGRRVRLSRIPYKDIRSFFSNCEIVSVPDKALDLFYDKGTYIYSARTCTSRANMPIKTCVKKIKELDAYETTWNYLIKVSINHNTKIINEDLFSVVTFFENLENCGRFCIAIGYDDSLRDNEVRLFQVQYFWDGGPGFLRDELIRALRSGASLEEIKHEYENKSPEGKSAFIDEAYYWMNYSESRTFIEVNRVLVFLDEIGCDPNGILNRWLIHGINLSTAAKRAFEVHMLQWAIDKKAKINHVYSDSVNPVATLLNILIDKEGHLSEVFGNSSELGATRKMIAILRKAGGMTVKEKRKSIRMMFDKKPLREWLDEYLNS